MLRTTDVNKFGAELTRFNERQTDRHLRISYLNDDSDPVSSPLRLMDVRNNRSGANRRGISSTIYEVSRQTTKEPISSRPAEKERVIIITRKDKESSLD